MDQIKERIELLISTKGMTNATFAEKIGVQPSSISHVMSGRNKASLDLVMKILNSFKEVRTEWLLQGKGSMTENYTPGNSPENYTLFGMDEFEASSEKSVDEVPNTEPKIEDVSREKDLKEISGLKRERKVVKAADKQVDEPEKEVNKELDQKIENKKPHKKEDRKIERIVIFYEDRSFVEYFPES